MTTIDVPSSQKIHMIAFLTMHGWTPTYYADKWIKEGVNREMTWDEQSNQRYHPSLVVNLEEWDLESAFDYQKIENEKNKSVSKVNKTSKVKTKKRAQIISNLHSIFC